MGNYLYFWVIIFFVYSLYTYIYTACFGFHWIVQVYLMLCPANLYRKQYMVIFLSYFGRVEEVRNRIFSSTVNHYHDRNPYAA